MYGCRTDKRGFHQKVVSYSLYGNFSDPNKYERYVKPMIDVINQVQASYPGWIVRIYTRAENHQQLQEIIAANSTQWNQVDICSVESVLDQSRTHLLKASQTFPMTWRFLPLLDPTVDVMMSRDADSYIIDREVVAVQEWLNSSAVFHVMRDHQFHGRSTPVRSIFFFLRF